MKKIAFSIVIFIIVILLLFFFNIMWKSPPHYKVNNSVKLEEPIMDMKTYETIWQTHRRPYIFSVKSKQGGEVHVLGVEHVGDPNHPQCETIRNVWYEKKPTVALVEGKLGFLFTWIQNPIEKYGEGGLTSSLAKNDDVDIYSWEPTRNDEIELLKQKYPVEKIALFYSFRPYFSNMRHGKPSNPEEKLQEYLDDRTDYNYIRDIYSSWEELDSIWSNDFPELAWRDYSDEIGWPEGYLFDIANDSNLARDEHLIQTIVELVRNGEIVFATVGSSHAPRIEKSLKFAIEQQFIQ